MDYQPHNLFGQRVDPWKDWQLGGGPGTFGQYGCLLCSFAMVGADLNHPLENPGTLNDKFLKAGQFISGNELGDGALSAVFGDIQVTYDSGSDFSDSPADLSKLNFDPSHERVILELDFDHDTTDGIQTHFVVLDNFDGANIFIRCPWYNDITNFAEHYGTSPTETILKIFHLTGTPTQVATPPPPAPAPAPAPPAPPPAPIPTPTPTPDSTVSKLQEILDLLQKIARALHIS